MSGLATSDRLRLAGFLAARGLRRVFARLGAYPGHIWRVLGPGADRLVVAPQNLHTADATFATDALSGRYAFAGISLEVDGDSPFDRPPPSDDWYDQLHGFSWLRHLRAAGSIEANQLATRLVDQWMDLPRRRNARAWDPEITAERLIAWFSQAPIILDQADHDFYRRFLRSLDRQVRHLRFTAADTDDGAPRLKAVIALTYAGLCLTNQGSLLFGASRWLADEIDRQVLPDGGALSRDPSATLTFILDFLPLRQTFTARGQVPPEALTRALDRMMPMLRFFRHSDGKVANFNGARAFYPDAIATALSYDDTRGKPVLNAQHSGYQRFEAGDTVVLMDSGRPPPIGMSTRAHAGCLSFEMSTRRQRLIVNCGVPRLPGSKWGQVARYTAAHSTAILADRSSCVFAETGWVADTVGPIVIAGPREIQARRVDSDEEVVFEGRHDGYLHALGVIHQRRLALERTGTHMTGTDRFLAGKTRRIPGPNHFDIRFHLHPAVRVAPLDPHRVLLLLQSGEGWVFSSGDCPVQVEDSVLINHPKGPMSTLQLLLAGDWLKTPSVIWDMQQVATRERLLALIEEFETYRDQAAAAEH